VPAVVLQSEDPHHQGRREQSRHQNTPEAGQYASLRAKNQQRWEGRGDLQQCGAGQRFLKAERNRFERLPIEPRVLVHTSHLRKPPPGSALRLSIQP
jgi:hypothetical protein